MKGPTMETEIEIALDGATYILTVLLAPGGYHLARAERERGALTERERGALLRDHREAIDAALSVHLADRHEAHDRARAEGRR